MQKNTIWTEEKINILINNYADSCTKELSKLIGLPEKSIRWKAYILKLKKSKERLSIIAKESANTEGCKKTWFKKGKIPWNKGFKGYKLPSNKGKFKTGNYPFNAKGIGDKRINKDGFCEIKVAKGGKKTWKLYHHHVWFLEHGYYPESKTHALIFKDGDRNNFDINNLELIEKYLWLVKTRIPEEYPEELKEVLVLSAKMRKEIKNRRAQDE